MEPTGLMYGTSIARRRVRDSWLAEGHESPSRHNGSGVPGPRARTCRRKSSSPVLAGPAAPNQLLRGALLRTAAVAGKPALKALAVDVP